MLLPARFGKYILLKELEVGGMAAVFLAKAQGIAGFEKFLAIKKIFAQLSRSEDFVQMFVSEARIAGELSHPNISHIYDLGEVEGDYFIAMEYIHGKDAYRLLKRCQSQVRRIPLSLVCYIILQVLEGLDYAHKKKDLAGQPMRIVHRDVSPRNILLSYDGGVKLIDFGIAKAATLGEHTRVGTIKGKVNYMSPEQARGEEIDARSDLFSVGLLMYELIYQAKLFAGGSEIKTLDLIRECNVPDLHEQNPDLPEELVRILTRSLARERELRYSSAHEMAKELQQFVHRNDMTLGSSTLAEFMQECFAKELEQEQRELDAFRHVALEVTGARQSGVYTGEHATGPGRASAGIPKSLAAGTASFPDDFVDDPTQIQPDEISPEDMNQIGTGDQSRVELAGDSAHRPARTKSEASLERSDRNPGGPGSRKSSGSGRSLMLGGLTSLVIVGAGIISWQMISASHSGKETASSDPSVGDTGREVAGGPGRPDPRVRELPAGRNGEDQSGTASSPRPDGSPGAVGVEMQPTAGTQAVGTGQSQAGAGLDVPGGVATGNQTTTANGTNTRTTAGHEHQGSTAKAPGMVQNTGNSGSKVSAGAVTASGPALALATPVVTGAGGHAAAPDPMGSQSQAVGKGAPPSPATGAPDASSSGQAAPVAQLAAPGAAAGTHPNNDAPSQAPSDTARSPGVARPADGITAFGYLNINSTSPCNVLVDGVATGLVTPVKQFKVPAGRRKIDLERISDKTVRSWEVDVKPQQVYPVIWR